jgi:hypothetical protein
VHLPSSVDRLLELVGLSDHETGAVSRDAMQVIQRSQVGRVVDGDDEFAVIKTQRQGVKTASQGLRHSDHRGGVWDHRSEIDYRHIEDAG